LHPSGSEASGNTKFRSSSDNQKEENGITEDFLESLAVPLIPNTPLHQHLHVSAVARLAKRLIDI